MSDLLHIYAQAFQHQEAWVVGDREALIKLRNALNIAIETNEPTSSRTFASDGEGYHVIVIPTTQEMLDELSLPYTEQLCEGHDTVTKYPVDVIGRDRYRALLK